MPVQTRLMTRAIALKERHEDPKRFVADMNYLLDEGRRAGADDTKLAIMCRIFDYIVINRHLTDLPEFASFKIVITEKLEECKEVCSIFRRDHYAKYAEALIGR